MNYYEVEQKLNQFQREIYNLENTIHTIKTRLSNVEKEAESAYHHATWAGEKSDRAYSQAERAIDIAEKI